MSFRQFKITNSNFKPYKVKDTTREVLPKEILKFMY